MASHIQIEINILSDERDKYLAKYDESYDEKLMKHMVEEPIEIDELRDKIIDLIIQYKTTLEFEFIIEQLTKLGQAPCLLYDDDGNFAITGDCMSSVPMETPADIDLSFSVKKEEWFPTIREALSYYLKN